MRVSESVGYLGLRCKAVSKCGLYNGKEVEGVLSKVDNWDAYITCDKGRVHMCNKDSLVVIG